jgi:SAM-dependent methyltransferase
LTTGSPEPVEPTLPALERKLEEEEAVYAELLESIDRLSKNPAPVEKDPGIPSLLRTLNEADALAAPEAAPRAGGLKGLVRRLGRKLLEPELAAIERDLARKRSFDSTLVQLLNRFSEASNAAHARSAELASALVRFSQRIDRLVDAKDRLYASLGTRRTDLLLEAMDKRLETARLGIERAQSRLEGLSSAVALARAELSAFTSSSPAARSSAPPDRIEEARYLAFEERFRGSSDEIRERLRAYVPYFRERSPVVDLGCGRGEFLELLREAGVEARGVDGNRDMVRVCREKELLADVADVIDFVASQSPSSAGGIFAAQLIEHLPPRALTGFLSECHRALRSDGRLIVETVNPRSLVALVESFYRDLTHEKPLHPETLDFALRAAGFRDVEIRYSSPVPERARLLPVVDAKEDSRGETLNRNFEKLNAFLFGDMDYAAIATK